MSRNRSTAAPIEAGTLPGPAALGSALGPTLGLTLGLLLLTSP
ncbi:MAG TPA: hypothetical protein VGF29_17745 [Hyphomicrobiaceae bacterium]